MDVDYFNQNIAEVKLKKHIVFLGNMYVAHNKDAVRGFIKEVLPVIRQKVNGVTFRIVGRCPDDFKEEMKQYDGIEVTGEVDDIRKYVQECQVAVAPLKYGSGIKTKILETMAMGIPVVTNKIGIEGLQIEDDYNIMVADKADVFAEKVIKCLEDDEYCSKISNNAKQFIKANHVWKDILKKFELIIN